MIRKLVTFLAITVSAVLMPARGQVEFKRGLEQISFIPKGQWITGVSVSFSQSNQNKYKILIIVNIGCDS